MPVILAEKDWAKWLGKEPATPEELKSLLTPFKDDCADHVAGQQIEDRQRPQLRREVAILEARAKSGVGVA